MFDWLKRLVRRRPHADVPVPPETGERRERRIGPHEFTPPKTVHHLTAEPLILPPPKVDE